MKFNSRRFTHKQKVSALIVLLVIGLLLFIQSQRSTLTATAEYYWRAYKYKRQNGQLDGNFTTNLNATWHHQEHSLSCEIAALKMALSVYGLDIPESELISKLNMDSTPRSKGVWGDPNSGFVGNIDGQMGVTGYGVYWNPIAAVGSQYLNAEARRFDSPSDLASEIANGHAVVAWGYNGRGNRITWKTPAGATINAINGEHARTIVGFSGDIANPINFLVYDPIYGKLSWPGAQVFENWQPFDNMGVVVYSDSVRPEINPVFK